MPIIQYTKTVYHYVCEVQENEHLYPRQVAYDICYANEDFDDNNEALSCGWTVKDNKKVYCPACSKIKIWEKENK